MRRKVLIALLALGTVGGFASGFASLRWRHYQHRSAFEQHVAKVCTDAAKQNDTASARGPAPSQPAGYGAPVVVNVIPGAAPQTAAPNAAPAAQPAAAPAAQDPQ